VSARLTTLILQGSNTSSPKPLATERGIRLLRNITSLGIRNVCCAQKQNTSQTVHQKCVLCTETEHFPNGTSEMCTVHRNRTLPRRYIRSVYCAQKQNTFQTVHQKCILCTGTEHFQTVHQKCVLCTETKHFPEGTSEMYTVHRNRTLPRRCIRNAYCAQKQNTFQTVHQKCILCTKTEHFQTVHQKCVLCTETKHFPEGTSEMYTVHRNRTLPRRCIRNVYCAHKQNIFQTVHIKQHLQITKQYLRTKLADIQSFKYTNISTLHKLNVIHRRYNLTYKFQFMLCACVGITNGGGRNANNEY